MRSDFPTTEINYTFRRIPSGKTIESWYELTPEQFAFSLKAPQRVTHFAKLQNCGDTLNYLFGVIQGLEHKLGPLLFQLPPSFKKDAQSLERLSARTAEMAFGQRSNFGTTHGSTMRFSKASARTTLHFASPKARSSARQRWRQRRFGYLRLRREDYNATDIARWADFLAFERATNGATPSSTSNTKKAARGPGLPPR